MKKIGVAAIIGFCVITLVLWVLSKPGLNAFSLAPLLSLGQALGLMAAVMASGQFVLATRWKPVENAFGGLDKVYKAHAWSGALAFLFMLMHPLTFVIDALPNFQAAKFLVLPLGPDSYLYGQLALLTFILLVSATLFAKLPYDIWKRTHTFMAVGQLFIFLHVLNIDSDVAVYAPLRWWMLGVTGFGLLAYLYIKLLYPRTYRKYEVSNVRDWQEFVEVEMKPVGTPLVFMPGQFVTVSFRSAKVSPEAHPFTISSAPGDANLRLSIKKDGDWTARLNALQAGVEARVFGPYGAFGEKSLARPSDDIWIAGGIGVTPFLSLLRHYAQNRSRKNIWFFYTVRDRSAAAYVEEITALARNNPKLKFIPVVSTTDGRLTADRVAREVKELQGKQVFICGPHAMLQDLWSQFRGCGVKPRNLIMEEFNFV